MTSDIQRPGLLGGISTYFGASVFSTAVPFLLLPVLTRVLTPEDCGIVAMFIAVSAVMASLSGLSVHGAIAVRYFQGDREVGSIGV